MGVDKVDSFMRLFLLPGLAHCGNGEGPDQVDLLSALMNWAEQGEAPAMLLTGKTAPQDRQPTQGMKIQPSQEEKGETSSAEDPSVQSHGIQKLSIPIAVAAAKVVYTRPVFPYPYIAKYNGRGDKRAPENYRAIKPEAYDRMHLDSPIRGVLGPDNQKNYTVKSGQLTVIEQ